MRINEHARCATRRDSAHKLSDSDHARLNVHVTVEQAGDEIPAMRVDDDRILPDCVAGIRTDEGYAPVHDGDICPVYDLAGLDADPLPMTDDEVGVGASHGDIYEGTDLFGRRGHDGSVTS
jgi:hypothetical protein